MRWYLQLSLLDALLRERPSLSRPSHSTSASSQSQRFENLTGLAGEMAWPSSAQGIIRSSHRRTRPRMRPISVATRSARCKIPVRVFVTIDVEKVSGADLYARVFQYH